MSHQGHLYRLGIRGRSVTGAPGVGGTTFVAHVACSRCPRVGERRLRQMMPPEQIDQKFTQAGWALDPHACPNCRAQAAQEKRAMPPKPSAAAIKAQAQMFTLLSQHFDPEKGAFAREWNDQRIASETGVSLDLVTAFRKEAFGDIKEAPEIAGLRADITSLEQLHREHASTVSQEIASLRGRLAKLSAAA